MDDRDLLDPARRRAPPAAMRWPARPGTTRAAVWKRIEALRAAGVAIAARAGTGYALEQPLDLLDAGAIRDGPVRRPPARQLAALEVAWSIDSTNTELLRRSTPVRRARRAAGRAPDRRPRPPRAHLGLAAGRAPVPVASRGSSAAGWRGWAA